MTFSKWTKLAFGALLAIAIHAAPAQAQATRTWVSGVGSDDQPCSRTAPCKTFAGAIAKTATGGEISVMDAGGYGAVTINKAITINGEGTLASILASDGPAIVVNAGVGAKVVLRNLQLNGAPNGTSGVSVISGNVVIDKCLIQGFNTGFIGGMGVLVSASGTTIVDIKNTDILHSSYGVWASTSSSFAVVNLDNVRINSVAGYGVVTASNGAVVSINRSLITGSGFGAIYTSSGNGIVNVTDTLLTNNANAVTANSSGSTVRLNNVSLYDNTTNFVIGAGATIATANNNRAAGGGATTTNGTVNGF